MGERLKLSIGVLPLNGGVFSAYQWVLSVPQSRDWVFSAVTIRLNRGERGERGGKTELLPQ